MRTLCSNRLWPLAALGIAAVAGCAGAPSPALPPLTLVSHVDLPRYMGDWYVIASIPTSIEKSAYNAKENYRLEPDGSVPTTYSFNADDFDGPRKTYESRATIVDRHSNAVWGQQYVWPFQADYRISYLSPDYGQVVVTREKRDYVWIMARTPSIAEPDYERLAAFVAAQGYDAAKLRRVPQAGAK
jgi:apolipoprotein D and lipocalin family protein